LESACWGERLGALAEVGLELSNNKNEVSKKSVIKLDQPSEMLLCKEKRCECLETCLTVVGWGQFSWWVVMRHQKVDKLCWLGVFYQSFCK
jgi:hypothetical protein